MALQSVKTVFYQSLFLNLGHSYLSASAGGTLAARQAG